MAQLLYKDCICLIIRSNQSLYNIVERDQIINNDSAMFLNETESTKYVG